MQPAAIKWGMAQLVAAFPQLKQLTVHVPAIAVRMPGHWTETGSFEGGDGDELIDSLESYHLPYSMTSDAENSAKHTAAGAVAAVASVANAIFQLGSLQVLTMTGMPDIWKPRFYLERARPGEAHDAAESAIDLAVAAAAEGFSTNVRQNLQPFVSDNESESSTAVVTVGDFGCWLLQQHDKLRHMRISTTTEREGGWTAEWQEQHALDSSTTDHNAAINYRITKCSFSSRGYLGYQFHWRSPPEDLIAISSEALPVEFNHHLSQYSSQPAADGMRHISSCHMMLTHDEVIGLGSLLGDLKSLKQLKIGISKQLKELEATHPLTATAMKAAATVSGLQSLDIYTAASTNALSPDVLLPLTAAAGGPGSSLTSLSLSEFVTDMAIDDDHSYAWRHSLKHLNALKTLCVWHWGPDDRANFLVDSLPVSLQMFEGRRLNLVQSKATVCFINRGNSSSNRTLPTRQHKMSLESLTNIIYCCTTVMLAVLVSLQMVSCNSFH